MVGGDDDKYPVPPLVILIFLIIPVVPKVAV